MEKTYLEHMFEILGVNPYEEFRLRLGVTYINSKYRFNDDLSLVRKFDGEENWIDASDLLYKILNGKFTLIKLPPQPIKVSKEDKIVIDYYKLCGYKWLVKNKDGEVNAYIDKPEKLDVSWDTSNRWEDDMVLCDVNCVSWEDEEPFSLNREFEVVE